MSTRWVTAVPNLSRHDKYSRKCVHNALSGNVQVGKEGHMHLERVDREMRESREKVDEEKKNKEPDNKRE